MERYLGLDVHGGSTTVCVLSETGKRVALDVLETHGAALVGYLQHTPGRLHVCLEESEWAAWLWEILHPHVAELVVCRGRKSQGSKNDAVDAGDLAERLRTGQIRRPIFKGSGPYTRLRELARVYRYLRQDLARTKNRYKSAFRRRGVSCAGPEIYAPEGRARGLSELPAWSRWSVEHVGTQLDGLEQLKRQAEAEMVKEAHRFKTSRLLETLPGLGPVRVALLLPVVVTPFRFRTKRQFWAYCGLAVVMHSSSDWVPADGTWIRAPVARPRGLNRNFNRQLKEIFKGAARSAISAQANPFRQAYERLLEQGTKPNLARLTIARKLAATCLAMWKTGKEYDPSY